ncbi:hypothetical protein CVT25_014637 [Psilocybe cyanescens]|uniref:Uncharacterized protein n=1 Tax=Psilocybe cyanescens TaxID=93625 RepID=A0A409WU40_PSICY|nr:hypothetical protein CVT25_014637 [Psilocybe cyanescens]
MSSRRRRSPARLILRRREQTRYPPWAFGFHLSMDEIIAAIPKLSSTPSVLEGEGHLHSLFLQYHDVFHHVEMQMALQSDAFGWKWATIDAEPCYVNGGQRTVLSLFKCTRPSKDFLPEDDKLDVMKKIMAEAGFTKEPAWYRVAAQ